MGRADVERPVLVQRVVLCCGCVESRNVRRSNLSAENTHLVHQARKIAVYDIGGPRWAEPPGRTEDDGAGVDTDPENDLLSVSQVNAETNPAVDVAGLYGTLDWNTDGSYTYTLNNALPAVQALNSGDTLTDTFVYTVSDGNGGTDTANLVVTINGRDEISFDIGSTASISEENTETATFTLTLGGGSLVGANTASVDIDATGTALSGTDYEDFVAAVAAAAAANTGVTFDGANTLTFDSSFVGANGETPVNTTTADDQKDPAMAMNGSGRYVVAWQSINQDGDQGGIYARVYDATGTAVTGEVLVNATTTAGNQAFMYPKRGTTASSGT